jgi:ABC-type multidrug transport system ATPase subunit
MTDNCQSQSEQLLKTSQNNTTDKIMIEWYNLNYHIRGNKNKEVSPETSQKVILNDISGFALPNEILAIMGPSGSGKTTLLNLISDRQLPSNKSHIIKRDVRANDHPIDHSSFGKIAAYVMQDDILMECLTPRESLYFAARLKIKASAGVIKSRVEDTIAQVSQWFNV